MSDRRGIELESLSMSYETPAGSVRALEQVTLELEPGRSLAITGASGCGKSTLLGLIGGLDTPTSGSVWIEGREISRLPEQQRAQLRRRELGFVFQSDNLQPFLTVAENVSIQLALAGAPDVHQRSLEMLARLEVGDQATKLPDQLSGGQRQRAAVARALVHRPRLILADEPTGALDERNSAAVVELLLEAKNDLGATLVVVTHDPRVAARMDSVVALHDGRLVEEGRQARAR